MSLEILTRIGPRSILIASLLAVVATPVRGTPVVLEIERLEHSVPATFEGIGVANLILDDGSREANVGFGEVTASQFLWFNAFDGASEDGVFLDQIQVLFPPSTDYGVGDAVQLVVYGDTDQDPTNGADLLLAFDDVIQFADGTTFSAYSFEPPLEITAGQDILLGVINRFVESGVSVPSRPAALDTSASQGRSYFALWSGDPPSAPELPADLLVATIDTVEAGNWMIRGVVRDLPVIDIPSLDEAGLTILILMLAACGALVLRRRS